MLLWILAGSVGLASCGSDDGARGPAGPAGVDGVDGVDGTGGSGGGGTAGGSQGGDGGQSVEPDGYASSAACMGCHEEEHASWVNSAHPYKIVSKDDAVAGTGYPTWVQALRGELYAVDADLFSDQAALISINAGTFPNGGWDDVSYIIGGYGWKARFIGTDGYIITGTAGDNVQYNPPFSPGLLGPNAYLAIDATSAEYHPDELKPYDCGGCHTTGWVPDDDAETDGDLSDNQDGLPGIWGTWVEPGVGCEACHGPSAEHAKYPFDVKTPLAADDTCSNCHIRGYKYDIDVKGGFIKHHEQSEELSKSKHAVLGCVGCHDSHSPVRYETEWLALDGTPDDPNPDFTNRPGVRTECLDCHFEKKASYEAWAANFNGMVVVACEQCHMPRATKSAVKVGTFGGDVATHLFGINAAVDPIASPELSTTGMSSANPYISLDWACGGCHSDTVEGTDALNPDFYVWAQTAIDSFGGVHGNAP